MKKIWLASAAFSALVAAGPALAADLGTPRVAPVYKAPIVVPYTWTGCYVGVEGGGAWGNSSHTAESGRDAGQAITGSFSTSGGLAGGTVGCNYQVGSWVFGLEEDLSWTNKKGSANDIQPFNVNTVSTTKEKWLDTFRGRVGYSWDRTLVYATGGLAVDGAAVNVALPNGSGSVDDSKTVTGWTVGAGLEYAFWNNWSLKAEYLYADFGSSQFVNPPVQIGNLNVVTRDVRLHDNIVRAGLNYRFNWQ
jgi:outer membrane immunogenic protein